MDIRHLSEGTADQGRASVIFQYGDNCEVVQLNSPRDSVVVGRSFPADVCLDIASLSRQHARFIWSQGQLWIEDLDSLNGVWFSDKRIQKQQLDSGDRVKLGDLRAFVAISPSADQRESVEQVDSLLIDGALVLSSEMRELYDTVERIAKSDVPVLILGETGTGKELVATRLHNRSLRGDRPLQVVNCGAIPENLIESFLFGHEKGAFTGATKRQTGVFENAQGGSVFLDEIGELPLPAQAAFLRVLETKKVTRLGNASEISVDVRIVAATHCDVNRMVEEGVFREDLVHRLNTFVLQVPPLRERREEIIPLAELFLKQACREWRRTVSRFHPDAIDKLEAYSWPGNIRQLRNVIERGALLCEGDCMRVSDLPPSISNYRPEDSFPPTLPEKSASSKDIPFKDRIRKYELEVIREALQRTGGNQRAAARLLRMPYRTLSRKAGALNL